MEPHRFTRAARMRVKPVTAKFNTVTVHHGDEFDEEVAVHGHLTVIPTREYTARIPQTLDEFGTFENEDRQGPFNQLGPVIEGAVPVVTSRDFESYMAAFDKRTNSQPDANDDCTDSFLQQALQLWESVPISFTPFDVDETIYEEWLSKMAPEKQARMHKAFLELFAVEDDSAYLGEKTLSVKIEALLKRYDPKWAPRLIYAGNDSFNALTGPVAMVLCQRLDSIFEQTRLGPIKYKFCYKKNDVQLARHLAESEYCNGTEGDFSANDLRQRAGASVVFDKFCEKVGAPSWFRKLLMDMRFFKTKNLEFGHRAEAAHQLPTGTTITTPRNTVWNSTIESVYASFTNNCGDALVLGDDFSAMMKNRVDTAHWAEWVATQPKMKLTGCTPELSGQMTMLSRRLCVDVETPCMMPKLGKALARFNVRVSPNQAISDSAYMAGKALSYAYEFRHFPLFRDLFLERYETEEDNANVSTDEISWFTRTSGVDVLDLKRSIIEESVLISEDATREFLMDAYGDFFGLVDALGIARSIILRRDADIIDAPQELAVDWE